MRKRGKKFTAARAQVAADRTYSIEEAIPLVQKVKYAKFDETVELTLRLGVDPKHADQMVRGTVVLPHGLGKTKRVLAIAGGFLPPTINFATLDPALDPLDPVPNRAREQQVRIAQNNGFAFGGNNAITVFGALDTTGAAA